MNRTGDEERADVVAFLDKVAALPDEVYLRACEAKSADEVAGARRALIAARRVIASGKHVPAGTTPVLS